MKEEKSVLLRLKPFSWLSDGDHQGCLEGPGKAPLFLQF